MESYIKEAKLTLMDLEKFHQRLADFTTGERLNPSADPSVFNKHTFDANKIVAQKVLQAGWCTNGTITRNCNITERDSFDLFRFLSISN